MGRDGENAEYAKHAGHVESDDEIAYDTPTPTIPARTAFRRFWPLTKGLRRWLVTVWLCTVLAALAETEAILLFGDLTDHALQKGSLAAFWDPAVKWLAVAVAGAVVAYMRQLPCRLGHRALRDATA